MKKFRVISLVTISLHTDVEAESAEEAKNIASERPLKQLCWHCSGGNEQEEWCTSGELDGDPFDIDAEEV